MAQKRSIYFFKDYLTEHYGRPLYRIPVDLPLSCPNRQRNSGAGCIFCAEDGARARHLRHNLDLPDQVRKGIAYAQRRYGAEAPYIAYFQSYTNTYADVNMLRDYYEEVLKQADFKMVIIATRPDCLEDDVLDYLEELNRRYDLWIELGVQTSNNRTLELIRRGHDFSAVITATEKLSKRNIKCAAHVILGLPYEDIDDFIKTGEDIAALPFAGVKIHNLLVLKKTPLAKMFEQQKDTPGVFNVMSEYDYAAALAEFLKRIPHDWPVMRITADAPADRIIAPKWWMSKGQFIEYVQEFLSSPDESERFAGAVPKVKTADGSYTFYHPEFKQHFHTLAGAATEAFSKFVEPSGLKKRLAGGSVKLLDIGFGLGYNTCAAVKCAIEQGDAVLDITTLELDLKTLQAGLAVFDSESLEHQIISSLIDRGAWRSGEVSVRLITGDARITVRQLEKSVYDIIFFDGFSPDKNPELWTYDFLRNLSLTLKKNGIMTTYSSAFPVIGALIRSGMSVGVSEAFGRKKGGTVAAFNSNLIVVPLPEKEMGIVMKSTAGLSYRDPAGLSSKKVIISHRDKLVARLRKRGIPRWYKG